MAKTHENQEVVQLVFPAIHRLLLLLLARITDSLPEFLLLDILFYATSDTAMLKSL